MNLASHEPDYEYEFDPDAENNTAATIYRMVQQGGPRVLDLGSGPGIVAAALTKREGKDVICIDSEADFLDRARERGVGRTIEADLDDGSWVDALEGERFDVIVLADVLEHLEHPGSVLDVIRDRELLSDGGYLVVSIPNVAHESIIASLIAGRFDYTPSGLLDATHIRFFTRETFQRLCEEHGFFVTRLERTLRTIEQTEMFERAESIAPGFRRQLLEDNLDARTYQYVLRVEPGDLAHQIAVQRRRADQEERRRIEAVEEARGEVQAAEKRIEELGERYAELEHHAEEKGDRVDELERFAEGQRRTIEALEDELEAARAAVGDARSETDRVERERSQLERQYEEQYEARQSHYRRVRELERKLEGMYASETWKAGRALMWLPRKLKRSLESGPDDEQESEQAAEPVDPRSVLEVDLLEDRSARDRYREELERRRFGSADHRVVIGVSTTDLDEGRGDLYTALGLGLALRSHGYEMIYLPYERWDEIPPDADIFVSLLAEPTKILDPRQIPSGCTLIGWVRNNTERWIEEGMLGLYDGVLCSSPATLREIQRVYRGPAGLLRIGVDLDLYSAPDGDGREGVAATVNQWGGTRTTYATLERITVDFPLGIFGTQRTLDASLEPFQQGHASFFQLPSLYGQVALVLDDQQDVNRPYGNVNSRIFESLAGGALPITDSPAGLDTIGLGSVPVYDGPEDLVRKIHMYLGDAELRRELVGGLRDVVLEEHGYAARARTFDAFLTENELGSREVAGRAGAVGGVVAFQPDYRVTNPYQDMLYASLGKKDLAAVPITDPSEILTAPRLRGRRAIFHLHWTATILGPARSRSDAQQRCRDFLSTLDHLRERGVPIVWTVHNQRPHECSYPAVENDLRNGIAERADLIHVMCRRTVDLLEPDVRLPEERVHVVPHGSYVDVYPNLVDAGRARRDLGLAPDQRVLLFFGQVRPYKGLDRLLDAFTSVRRDRSDLRLIVAGAPGRFEGVRELVKRCETTEGVVARLEEIPGTEIQRYFNACDVVVLPHQKVLNSGGVMLAFSYGRPVIAPRAGCLPEMVTPEVGRLFGPDDELRRSIAEVDELCTPGHRSAAFEAAMAYPFTNMAADLAEMIDQL